MKKNKILLLTKIVYSLFLIGTIIACIIVYNNIDNNFDYIFKNCNIDLLKACTHALGLSFGMAFIDITFLKKGF